MIKHDYGEEEMVWMRLKLLKMIFLSDTLMVKPTSRCDVRWRRRDVGFESKQRRDVVT